MKPDSDAKLSKALGKGPHHSWVTEHINIQQHMNNAKHRVPRRAFLAGVLSR